MAFDRTKHFGNAKDTIRCVRDVACMCCRIKDIVHSVSKRSSCHGAAEQPHRDSGRARTTLQFILYYTILYYTIIYYTILCKYKGPATPRPAAQEKERAAADLKEKTQKLAQAAGGRGYRNVCVCISLSLSLYIYIHTYIHTYVCMSSSMIITMIII